MPWFILSFPLPKHYALFSISVSMPSVWYIPAFCLLFVHYVYGKWGARKDEAFYSQLYVMGSHYYYAYFSNSWLLPSHLMPMLRFSLPLKWPSIPHFQFTSISPMIGISASFQGQFWEKLLVQPSFVARCGRIVFIHQGIDKTSFGFASLFALFLVNWLLRQELVKTGSYITPQRMERFIFLFASNFIESSFYLLQKTDFAKWQQGRITFLLTLLLTHLCRSHFIWLGSYLF